MEQAASLCPGEKSLLFSYCGFLTWTRARCASLKASFMNFMCTSESGASTPSFSVMVLCTAGPCNRSKIHAMSISSDTELAINVHKLCERSSIPVVYNKKHVASWSDLWQPVVSQYPLFLNFAPGYAN